MSVLIGFFRDFLMEVVRVLYESGLFVLFGFFVAGLLHHYMSTERIARYLGGRNLRSIVNAAILGAPLPLCSCGVLPTAVALRRKGASREAALSFLVSTPETSVESIAISYSLLGPVFAIVRPVAAVLSAMVAGVAHLVFGVPEEEGRGAEVDAVDAVEDTCSTCTSSAHVDGGGESHASQPSRFRSAVHYAFVSLFDDLVFWFLLGVLLTGLIGAILPEGFFARYLGGGLLSMLFAVLVGVPLYMCASGSTPVAAAFLAKGLNPGATLVFLLTGPATNAATITVVGRVFGRRFLQIFIGSVVLTALAAGFAFNRIYTWSAETVPGYGEGATGFILSAAKGIALLAFLYLSYRSLRRTGLRGGLGELRENMVAAGSAITGLRPRHLWATWPGRAFTAAVVLLYIGSGFYTVAPGEVAMERDFGIVTETSVPPGLHWCFPWPVGKQTRCSVDGVVRIDIGFRSGETARDPLAFYAVESEGETALNRVLDESIYVTGDENLIDLIASVHYLVEDPVRFAFGVESAESVVRDATLWAFVREIIYRPIDHIYTSDRLDVERKVVGRANRILEEAGSGLRIAEVRLLDTHAPREVHYDFRDVASSKEDRARMIHEARVYWEGTVKSARGDSARTVAEAAGSQAVRVADATGAAARFQLLEEAARIAPNGTRLRLYLESMERILPGARTVVRPDPRSIRDFELWFQTGESKVLPDLLGQKKEGELP